MSKEEDDEFSELCYEAWMTGHSPDDVDRDRYDDCLNRGFYLDEISLNMVLPKNTREEEEV